MLIILNSTAHLTTTVVDLSIDQYTGHQKDNRNSTEAFTYLIHITDDQ